MSADRRREEAACARRDHGRGSECGFRFDRRGISRGCVVQSLRRRGPRSTLRAVQRRGFPLRARRGFFCHRRGDRARYAADIRCLLIADGKKPLALGGIMGGEASAVSDSTVEVFLEAAWFNPSAVAGRARRFALSSDAAFRFERGVDFSATAEAIERATQLIFDVCGGAAGPISEARATLPQRNPVRLRSDRASKIIGVQFSDEQIAGLLKRLQLPHARSGGEFTVTPPSYRFDLEIEEDMVEEIARLYGYDDIPSRPPQAALRMLAVPDGRRTRSELKRILVDREYFEVVNFSFVEAQWERDFCGNTEPITLENPIASQLEVMRSSLIRRLVANLS